MGLRPITEVGVHRYNKIKRAQSRMSCSFRSPAATEQLSIQDFLEAKTGAELFNVFVESREPVALSENGNRNS